MKVYVVKYDSTEPYDPGTVEILGAYASKNLAELRVSSAKIETKPGRRVDWDETYKRGRTARGDWDYIYINWPVLKYSDRDDYFEITELELDDALPIQVRQEREN